MLELFTTYTLTDIILFSIILAIAVKGLISFYDWAKGRAKGAFDKGYEAERKSEKVDSRIEKLNTNLENVNNNLESIHQDIVHINDRIDEMADDMGKRIDGLIESDMEDIKSFITEKHHHFVYEVGWIDNYSLECLNKRFSVYELEGGNTFIKGLMDEISALPKIPPKDTDNVISKQYADTQEYVTKSHLHE